MAPPTSPHQRIDLSPPLHPRTATGFRKPPPTSPPPPGAPDAAAALASGPPPTALAADDAALHLAYAHGAPPYAPPLADHAAADALTPDTAPLVDLDGTRIPPVPERLSPFRHADAAVHTPARGVKDIHMHAIRHHVAKEIEAVRHAATTGADIHPAPGVDRSRTPLSMAPAASRDTAATPTLSIPAGVTTADASGDAVSNAIEVNRRASSRVNDVLTNSSVATPDGGGWMSGDVNPPANTSPLRARHAAAQVLTTRAQFLSSSVSQARSSLLVTGAAQQAGETRELRRELGALNDKLHTAERERYKVEHDLKVKLAVKEDLCKKLQDEVQGLLAREADREATLLRVENEARSVKERLAVAEEKGSMCEAKITIQQRAAAKAEDAHQLAALQLKRQDVDLSKYKQMSGKLEQLLEKSRETAAKAVAGAEEKKDRIAALEAEVKRWEDKHRVLARSIDDKEKEDSERVKAMQARNDELRGKMDALKNDFAMVLASKAESDAKFEAKLERADYNETVLNERLSTAQKTIDCVEAQLAATQAKLDVALQDCALKQATIDEHVHHTNTAVRQSLSAALPLPAQSPGLPPASRDATPLDVGTESQATPAVLDATPAPAPARQTTTPVAHIDPISQLLAGGGLPRGTAGDDASFEEILRASAEERTRLVAKVRSLEQQLEQLVLDEGAAQADVAMLRAEVARWQREADDLKVAHDAAMRSVEEQRVDGVRFRDEAAAAAATAHEDATRRHQQLQERFALVEEEKKQLLQELAATQAQVAALNDVREDEATHTEAVRQSYEEQIAATRALVAQAEANAAEALRELQLVRTQCNDALATASRGDQAAEGLEARVRDLTAQCLAGAASLTETRTALAQAQATVEELSQEVQRAAADAATAQHDAARWREMHTQLTEQREQERQDALDREAQADARCSTRDTDIASLKKQVQDTKRSLRAAQDDLAQARAEVEQCTSACDERVDELRDGAAARQAEHRRQVQRLETRNHSLDTQVKRLTAEVAAAEDEAASLQAELDAARAQGVRVAGEQAKDLRQQLSELRGVVAAKDRELADTGADLDTAREELAQARTAVAALERQKGEQSSQKVRVAALEGQLETLRGELATARRERTDAVDHAAQLEQNMATSVEAGRRAQQRHEDERDMWKRREALLQAQHDTLEADVEERRRTCAALEAEKRRVEQERAEAASELRSAQRSLEAASSSGERELSGVRARLAGAERELEERREEVARLEAQVAREGAARRDAEEKLDAYENPSPRLRQEVEHLKEDVAGARGELAHKERHVASLTSDIEVLRADLASTAAAGDTLRRDAAEARDKLHILMEQKGADKLAIARLEGIVAELENAKEVLEAQAAQAQSVDQEAAFLSHTRPQLVAQIIELRDAIKVSRQEAVKVTREGTFKKAASAVSLGIPGPKIDRALVEHIQGTCKKIDASKKAMEELVGKYLTGTEKLRHGVQAGYTAGPQQESMVEVSDDGLDDRQSSRSSQISRESSRVGGFTRRPAGAKTR